MPPKDVQKYATKKAFPTLLQSYKIPTPPSLKVKSRNKENWVEDAKARSI
jgi:hypothetical protein